MARTRLAIPFVLLILATLASPPLSPAGEPASDPALVQAREALLARDFSAAIRVIEERLEARPDDAGELRFLLARALRLSGRAGKALETLERLLASGQDAPWRDPALFEKADILVDLGRMDEALDIYETRARALTSKDRRLETARTYLKFAEDFFDPPDEVKRPDFARAEIFFAKAMDMGLPADKEAEVLLKRAEALSHLRGFAKARKLLASWRKEHEDHPKEPALALAQGEAELALSRWAPARRLFRDLLADDAPADTAVKALFGIARSYRLPEPRSATDLEQGIEALRRITRQHPDHEAAPRAAFEIGASYAHLGRFHEACRELEAFLGSPLARPGADEVPRARHLLGRCRFRRKEYEAAIRTWRGFLSDHPSHGLWTEVQRRIIDAEYAVGADRYADDDMVGARRAWNAFLADHPLDARCPGILLRFGKADHEKGRFEDAVDQWEKLVSKYAKTTEASEAQFLIGRTLEEDLERFAEAIRAYRKLDWGPFQAKARERIRILEREEMRLRTERIFRTDEKPEVQVSVRNLETVEFRAWAVDLESYFRKMHTAEGIEKLDVPLIEPDASWTVTIDPYEPYREVERSVTLPVEGPGVWAVNAVGADLEATTVVVQSDLGLVIKASRRNLLVFAVDQRTAKPAPGVDVIVSDGKKIILESTTGSDGVLFKEPEGIASTATLRVLGARNGSWASNTLNLRRLPAAVGLSPKGYLFSDRPAYRPGDTVHLKGVVRDVVKGAYAFEKGTTCALSVIDPRHRPIRRGEAELDGFGALDWSFILPASAATGTYRVRVALDKRHTFPLTFRVVEYRVPDLNVEVELEEDILYRGEPVQGTVRVSTFFGEPAPGRTVEIRFGSLPLLRGTTDETGAFPFTFETRDFRETQTVAVRARVPAEDAAGAANVHLSTTGFRVSLETLRGVYIAGEPFDLQVEAKDIAGEAVASALEVGVYRLETDDGRVSEVLVNTHEVRTGEGTGTGKVSVTLREGGRYRFRARGRDRFDNPVTAEAEVFISGEEDEVKLRILSEREAYRLGESPLVDVFMRLPAKPVLLAFEGERIFRYRVARMLSGKNAVKIRLDDVLAPNFILSAVALDGSTIHEAHREFRVTRDLRISLRPLGSGHEPGGTLRVEVETTDPMGGPVPAELCLAMVDRAYLSIFPRDLPDPGKHFFTRRRHGCSTVSTNTFSFEAETRKVLAALREEENRLEQARHKKEALKRLVERMKNGRAPAPTPTPAPEARWDAEEAEADGAPRPSGGGAPWSKDAKDEPARFAAGKKYRDTIGIGGAPGGRGYLRVSALALMEDVRAGVLETGYWNPRIVTGPQGKTVIEIPLPANVTTWQILAMGVTQDLLVGTAESEATVRKPLVVTLKSPASAVEGDTARVRGRVRNLSGEKVNVALTLAWSGDETAESLGTRRVSVAPSGEAEVSFELAFARPGTRTLKLLGVAGSFMDAASEAVRVAAKGTEIRRGFGGSASGDHRVRVEIPEKEYVRSGLAVTVGASLPASLLEIGEAPPALDWCRCPIVFFSPADRGLLALAKLDYLKALGREDRGTWRRLEADVEAAIAELAATQGRGGGFSWTPGGNTNIYATAQAVRFLALASAAGFEVERGTLLASRRVLKAAFASTENETVKTAILRAQAHVEKVVFSYANRLYRLRESLGPWARASLACTLVEMDRREMASQVATLVASWVRGLPRPGETPGPGETPAPEKRGGWQHRWVDMDRAETLALSVLALCRALPSSPVLDEAVDRMMALKTGAVWPTGKATAAAARALSAYLSKVKAERESYGLTVKVNGRLLASLDMDREAGRRTLVAPPGAFAPGENFVDFAMEGSGRFTWRIEFIGLTREPDDSQKNRFVRLEKEVLPRPRLVGGREAAPGFSCVDIEPEDRWVNRLESLPEGEAGRVEIRYAAQEGEGYLILEDTLPGGAVLQQDSLQGDFDHVETYPGKIVVFLKEGARTGRIRYRFFGFVPGAYRTPPPRVWSAMDPMRLSTGDAGNVTVLPAGRKSDDPYRPTPDELLAVGRERFEAEDFGAASQALSRLFENFRVKGKAFGDVARMLLFSAVALDRPEKIVDYFEILKERFGSVEIPFEDSLKIAGAYRALDEDELALQIYQGLLEASFFKEANVAADLEDQGRRLDSVAFMEDLLADYPDLPLLVSSRFALAQTVYGMAEAGSRPGSLSRARLVARAAEMLRAFLARYPTHRLSDEAGFSLANAYLALEAGKQAGTLAETLSKVHGKSAYLDDFHYIAALAYFRAREWARALGHARALATERFLRPDGSRGESPLEHLAVYILGQIHHAQGEFEKAAAYYEKVSGRFADARAALEQFRWKRLSIPEVERFETGGAVEIEVAHRNLASLNLLVYPVDLMKLYLTRRNLDDIASVNLAGIRPFHAAAVDLGEGAEYRDRKTMVALPVKKEGAYLVVAKGDGVEASGLVLVTDLDLEVQEDTASGRLRVTVRDEKEGGFEEDAHVKVVGSESGEFVSGNTDLRGVFEAGSLIGQATVVVKKEGSYAFFRGEAVHRPAVAARRRAARGEALFGRPPTTGQTTAQSLRLGDLQKSQELLEQQLGGSNRAIQERNMQQLRGLTRMKQQGMQAKQAQRK